MAEKEGVTEGTLVVVWNADSGWQHALLDSLHKVASPGTYSCKLCQLTHGLAGPKTEWSKFLKANEGEVLFYHRGQFKRSAIGKGFQSLELPAVLTRTSGQWQILLSKAEIMQFQSLDDLLKALRHRGD